MKRWHTRIPHSLIVGSARWLFPEEGSMEREKRGSLHWQTHLPGVQGRHRSDRPCWQRVLWGDVTRSAFYLCGPSVWSREKQQTNPNRGTFHKISDQWSSKPSRSSKTRKVQGTVTAPRSLRRHNNWTSCGTPDGILHRKRARGHN